MDFPLYLYQSEADDEAYEGDWELDKRMRRDKRRPGGQLELDKSEMVWDIAALIKDCAIQISDLEGFSDELVDTGKGLSGR